MRRFSGFVVFCLLPLFLFCFSSLAMAESEGISEATSSCLECHQEATPGIVASWKKSRHAKTKVADALKKKGLKLKVSSTKIPDSLKNQVVGCAECHIGTIEHKEAFEHDEFEIHTVVTPKDCAQCHAKEVDEYAQNIMSKAHGNLVNNPVYKDLMNQISGHFSFSQGALKVKMPTMEDLSDSCLNCHGTVVKKIGTRTVENDLGEFELPLWSNWPNRGVGRVNPDNSLGSCAACHSRHTFSMEMARKPATCTECHKGPDVPAARIYKVSKHGNIYDSLGHDWDFKSTPWVVGKDFTAPTCAACHISLLTDESDQVIAQRSHRMNDRLDKRLLGLIYAHSHPISPDTSIIKNAQGLPLPTTLDGKEAAKFLISKEEQKARRQKMQKVCLSCHSSGWVEGHFARLDKTVEFTNQATKAGTDMLLYAWSKGVCKGLNDKDSLFNEEIERIWVEQWLIFANNIRLAAAMMGPDYGVFADGRWKMSNSLLKMREKIKTKEALK